MRACKLLSWAAVTLALVGCQKPATPTQQAKPGDNKPILNVDAGQSAAMNVQRGKVVQKNKNDFAQLAMFYIQFETENNRAPANWEEFKAAIGREAPNLAKLVESGDIEIVYNAKPSSSTVLVYEKKPDFNNNQFAAFGDKHVEALTPDRLKQALQNR